MYNKIIGSLITHVFYLFKSNLSESKVMSDLCELPSVLD